MRKFIFTSFKGTDKRQIKKKIVVFVFLIGIVFTFILGEFMVRKTVTFPLQNQYMRFAMLDGYAVPEERFDADLFWNIGSEFRGRTYEVKKAANTYRIICIGDSCTYGYKTQNSAYDGDKIFSAKLEKLLQAATSKKTVEVINAGIGGYSSLQGYRYFKNSLLKYNPDLIIVWLGINDWTQAIYYTDKEQKNVKSKKINRSFLSHSHLYLFLKNVVFAKRLRRVPLEDYSENMGNIASLARENNIETAFILTFNANLDKKKFIYHAKMNKILESFEQNSKVMLIDFVPYFAQYKNIKEFFVDSAHPSEKGHSVVAQILYEKIKGKIR